MTRQNINSKSGFTIIEVVLVLAIAGLIFLMVFVALPALQRSQRDTQRRNDMSRVDTSLVQYQTNHSNLSPNLPGAGYWKGSTNFTSGAGSTAVACNTSACEFIRDYMNTGSSENDGKPNNFEDPSGTPYSMIITPNWSVATNRGNLPEGASAALSSNLTTVSNCDASHTCYTIDAGSYDSHVIYVIPGGRCYGDAATDSSSANHFAIMYRLEGAGTYCIDDQ